MAATQSYDYSRTELNMEPFTYANPNTVFLEEDAESYGDLWQLKQHITKWTFGISKHKAYIFLKYSIDDLPDFYTWNLKEKVESIEDHREHYIVIVLREVDDTGIATSHTHSIVIDVEQEHGRFDIASLMLSLQGMDMESLNDNFISKQLFPWQEGTARSVVKRLLVVWQILDRFAIVNVANTPTAKKSNKRQPPSGPRGDTTPKRGKGGSRPGTSRAEAQKRNPA